MLEYQIRCAHTIERKILYTNKLPQILLSNLYFLIFGQTWIPCYRIEIIQPGINYNIVVLIVVLIRNCECDSEIGEEIS